MSKHMRPEGELAKLWSSSRPMLSRDRENMMRECDIYILISHRCFSSSHRTLTISHFLTYEKHKQGREHIISTRSHEITLCALSFSYRHLVSRFHSFVSSSRPCNPVFDNLKQGMTPTYHRIWASDSADGVMSVRTCQIYKHVIIHIWHILRCTSIRKSKGYRIEVTDVNVRTYKLECTYMNLNVHVWTWMYVFEFECTCMNLNVRIWTWMQKYMWPISFLWNKAIVWNSYYRRITGTYVRCRLVAKVK